MFKRLKHKRIYEEIADQVMEAIARGDLRPRDKLPSEKELVDIFGVSRVTVREAIRSLEHSGVIEVRQGSTGGAYIREFDSDVAVEQIENTLMMSNLTIQELSEARAAIEAILIERFIADKINETEIAKLKDNVALAEKYFREEKNDRRLCENFKFHGLIVDLAENPVMSMTHRIVVRLSLPFFENVQPSTAMFNETMKQHREIVTLLEAEDYSGASQVCMHHILEVGKRIAEKSKMQSVFARSYDQSERSLLYDKRVLSDAGSEQNEPGGDTEIPGK